MTPNIEERGTACPLVVDERLFAFLITVYLCHFIVLTRAHGKVAPSVFSTVRSGGRRPSSSQPPQHRAASLGSSTTQHRSAALMEREKEIARIERKTLKIYSTVQKSKSYFLKIYIWFEMFIVFSISVSVEKSTFEIFKR